MAWSTKAVLAAMTGALSSKASWVGIGRQLAEVSRLGRELLEHRDPVQLLAGDAVTDRAGPRGDLGSDGREEAASGEDLLVDVFEKA